MILAEIDGKSFPQRGAGFCIRLTSGAHKWVRTMQCGKITTNQAELKALEYVLKSVSPEYYGERIQIKTTGRYATMMLERTPNGEWAKAAKSNVGLMVMIREYFTRFKDISIEFATNLDDVKKHNNESIRTGEVLFKREG